MAPTNAPTTLPPRPVRCIGRDREVETLVCAILAAEPTPILGSGGIGKSTVCLQALHDPRVGRRFEARRYFVRCDGARTAEDLSAALAAVLGVEPGLGLMGRITRALEKAPATLALDNLEMPWDREPLETEAVLAELAVVPDLSLVVTLRGRTRPAGVAWQDAVVLLPLADDAARRLFFGIAGNRCESDPYLDKLLTALDGLPLAIELMAHAAEAEPDLKGVWHRFANERAGMLKRGSGDDRLSSLAASVSLPLNSPRMTDVARRLLALLGLLPDGVARGHLDALLPNSGNAAAATLRQLALAFDEAGRLRTLAPIREHVVAAHPPEADDLQQAIEHYARMARNLGPKCGAEGGREAAARLSAEAANIESILIRALKGPDPARPIQAAIAFGQFQRFTGVGGTALLEAARSAAQESSDRAGEANCIQRLGDIALARSDHDGAREAYQQALPLYRRIGDVLGEANCIQRLGDIALRRSDHDGAREHYQKVLPLFQRVGDVLGEANCIQRLGDLALARSDHDGARQLYQQALPLYRRIGAVLGEANCIKSLGDLALARSDHDGARQLYEQALPLFQRVGDVLGEANCIQRLGDIALRRSDHDGAREHYQKVLPLFQRVGDVLGEANCIQRLGDLALARSDHDGARQLYQQALPLYRRIGAVLGEANCIKSLGDLALARSDHDGARQLYEQALPLFQRVGDVLGEANCIQRLGDIALRRSDHDGAREHYQKVLPLFQRVGDVLGEANCIQRLGDLALARSDHDGAREAYQQALPLYRRIGAVLGEANCIKSLGDIALARSDHDGARAQYETALAIYARIPEPYSIGWGYAALAQIAHDDAERAQHLQAAREAWRSIRRDDLVHRLDDIEKE